jgi:A/G-specific adenine glycosylase
VQVLANAKTSDVLRYWSGLGYNRRALYLQRCAKEIVEKFGGTFPKEIEQLKTLPGIGDYTAAAIACFAFDKQVAVLDTNIRKVLLTQFGIAHASKPKELQQVADQLLPKGKAYEWNQALMDYAALLLKAEKIPIPKQSTFKQSDRYFRGQIIKQLLERKEMTTHEISVFFALQQTPIDPTRLERVISGLVKDVLIEKKGNRVFLR